MPRVRIHSFPIEALPPAQRRFALAVAESTQTPVDLAALLMLGVSATAAAKLVEVWIKGDYAEPINLWLAVALPSGERKTGVLHHVTRPLINWEREENERLNQSHGGTP